MTIHRLDHAGVVVEDLVAAVAFFVELGLELESEATVEGEWVDQLVGLEGVRADLAVVRTPDGHGRVELSTFHTSAAHQHCAEGPINTRAFLASRSSSTPSTTSSTACVHGAELVGEVAQYEDIYRYCYIRGPAGIVIGLAEELR